MSDAAVVARWDGPVCFALLNRPAQGNAFGAALVAALDAVLDEARARDAQALVIHGAGKHFCTGFDLSGLDAETDDSLLARFTRIELLLQKVARSPVPTLALAHGRVVGAGADLFAACRMRAAVEGTSFAFPGARGFGLALGSRRLAHRIGAERALDWIASARTVAFEEARQAGLVGAVIASADASSVSALLPAVEAEAAVNEWVGGAVAGDPRHDDASDLAALVHSAAAPGLRDRIADYVARQAAARKQARP